MHKDLWNIKGVFFVLFFHVKFVVRGELRGRKRPRSAQWPRCRGRRSCDPPSCVISWLPPSRQTQRATKRARRDNRENVWWMKVLWLSLFLGGSFSQYCWFFVAYLCVAFFCYKRWLKKEEKENVVGWSLYSGRGWADAPIRQHFYSMVHCFDFCKPPHVFTCMSLSKKRVAQQNKTFTVSFPCPVR